MSLIQLLPDHIANQIAAGEVIQRPASVVKELMENAIDAGATKVDVNIKESGKSLIQVVDNGSGMSADDALLCFERHATSKVRKADDLFSLVTKGFRGEALASIAAIAHVEMRTKLADDATGTQINIEGSKVVNNTETVCPNGTSFEIKNLFYNVPARRNFLKSNKVEFRHIQDEFERVALAHSSIHFTLTHNDSEIYNLMPGVLRKRVVDVLGKKTNDRLVPIEESTDIVELNGFVLKPEYARKTRGEQFLFVNDRFFKSTYFNHAINKAFEGLLKERTYASYFLYLNVDPQKIDVNVHPTKTEIKFEEEKFIYSILLSSIRQALGKYNIAPTLDFERETSFDLPMDMKSKPVSEPVIKVNPDYNPFHSTSNRNTTSFSGGSSGKKSENFSQAITKHGFGTKEASSADWENFYTIDEAPEEEEPAPLIEDETSPGISQFLIKGNYIFTPTKSGLMVIHARRAYEQILYTDLISSFITNPLQSQVLLFPIEKELSKNELVAWESNAMMLKQLGFVGEVKEGELHLSAVPSVLQDETIQKALDRIVETIAHRDIEKGEIAHELVHSISKSASMKKMNLNSKEAVNDIIERLFQCENHAFTPGNKKIIDTLSLEGIDEKFR
ncbi:MAG: DNA mismatch repair endonuclease MutL [Flavobacteriales bacterium]|nr:DNA mismatch repair endonuclease MutL [Flavobacteriales bacterium]